MLRRLLLALPLLAASAFAQTWPTKPVTIVVPFPPGGGTDAFARPLFGYLGKATGKTFNLDNRGGAGGTLGAGVAAKAVPDGHNFFMGAVHHAIAPSVYKNLNYSLEGDFVPVALVSSVPQVIVVHPGKLPVRTLPELLAYVRANPGKLNYASAGNGTSHHLAGELFKQQTKTFITHIPYRGAGPALQDLVAGQIELMFDGLGSSAQHIRSGSVRAIAQAADKPAPGFANVPLAKDGGAPGYVVATWYGLWAPKGTPREAVAAMQAELRKAFASEEIKAAWTQLGSEPPALYGDDFGRFVSSETQRWAAVVKASGVKID
ncbi:Bug family tripartite tricarboxylate transporter substrate binding protein [Inhella sp.]|uniref:Bug family tripartite tricarboxylate transporter substrate binding protein n=1 Tax=Inhella sp. TaxID=1921806 RepID=UPI0035B327DD